MLSANILCSVVLVLLMLHVFAYDVTSKCQVIFRVLINVFTFVLKSHLLYKTSERKEIFFFLRLPSLGNTLLQIEKNPAVFNQ